MKITDPRNIREKARQFASFVLAAFCIVFVTTQVSAQQPAPAQQPVPAQQNNTQNVEQIVSQPIPQRTIGLEPGKIVRWTQRDAIIAALEKNVDIELERENVKLAQFDVFSAQGVYDPLTSSTIQYSRSIRPTSFRAAGIDSSSGAIENDTLTYNFGISKNIERFGSLIDVNFNNARQGSNTNNLIVQYSPSLAVNFTQPLFKNFRIDNNRRAIRIAKKQLDLSDAVFRQRAIEIISQVQEAYWNLALAIKNEEIARDSVKLAETQLNNNKRQVEVGTLAPIDVVSAATQVESRRQDVFVVMNSVAQAENALKALTVSGPDDDIWNARIEPVETFDITPISIPLDDAVKLAQENRPEIRQNLLQKDINKISVDFFRNQAKPQIDLIAGYSTAGLGGNPIIQTVGNCSNPITINNERYCLNTIGISQLNGQIVPIVSQTPFTTTSVPAVSDIFIGGYGQALTNLIKNDFRTWSVGVQFNFPLRNRTAKANLGKALEQDRQLELQNRRLMQNIEVQVRNAVQAVEIAKMRIEAARANREYAQKQLEGEEKRFQAGLTSTFFVLQRQNELSQARFNEIRALTDYNISVAQLQRVISTTLSSNNIEVKSDVQPVK
jgi:HAE1 family hydrophobic/amphiphilic exporter-1